MGLFDRQIQILFSFESNVEVLLHAEVDESLQRSVDVEFESVGPLPRMIGRHTHQPDLRGMSGGRAGRMQRDLQFVDQQFFAASLELTQLRAPRQPRGPGLGE